MRDRLNRFLLRLNWVEREDKIVLGYIGELKGVLDVGCGDGSFMEKFPAGNILGIDIDEERVRICKEKGLEARVMDALVPTLPDKFNAIHCSHLIEHLYSDQFRRLLMNMDGMLKAGGFLVVRSPSVWKGFYDEPTHIRPYPPKAVKKYLPDYQLLHLSYCFRAWFPKWGPNTRSLRSYLNCLASILSYLGVFHYRKDVYVMVLQKPREVPE